MEEDIRNISSSVAFSLAKFLMVVFSTRELDFYKNSHNKKHLHYTSTCGHKHKSVSLTFNRQSVSVIIRAGTRLFNNRRLIEYLKEATRLARLGTRSVLGAAGKVEI